MIERFDNGNGTIRGPEERGEFVRYKDHKAELDKFKCAIESALRIKQLWTYPENVGEEHYDEGVALQRMLSTFESLVTKKETHRPFRRASEVPLGLNIKTKNRTPLTNDRRSIIVDTWEGSNPKLSISVGGQVMSSEKVFEEFLMLDGTPVGVKLNEVFS